MSIHRVTVNTPPVILLPMIDPVPPSPPPRVGGDQSGTGLLRGSRDELFNCSSGEDILISNRVGIEIDLSRQCLEGNLKRLC